MRLFYAVTPIALLAVAGPSQRPKMLPETSMSHDGWYAEFPPAKQRALHQNKDLLIDFGGSDWCGPCESLKHDIFTKAAFNEKAQKEFVCVDIDDLANGLSPARKQRYAHLEKEYRVGSFPSVILATPEGLPYGWATYSPNLGTPEKFWESIQPQIARGKAFRSGLTKASKLSGKARAAAMVEAMREVRPDLLWNFHATKIAELRKLDPKDSTGFLAYLDSSKDVEALENNCAQGYALNPKVKVADVDNLISKDHLKGELLQRALIMKAVIETATNNQPIKALECFRKVLGAEEHLGPFDRHDYIPLTPTAVEKVQLRVNQGLANPSDKLAVLFALHRIFEIDFPDRYQVSCHGGVADTFRPQIAVRVWITNTYATTLLNQTAGMSEEDRQKAVTKALEGTFLLNTPTSGKVLAMVPDYFPSVWKFGEYRANQEPDSGEAGAATTGGGKGN